MAESAATPRTAGPRTQEALTGRLAVCDGRPVVIEWRIERHFFFTFEIDTEEVERRIPEALEAIETRPGTSLLSVGVLRFQPGHFGDDSPAILETFFAAHVAPNLSVRMPIPVMTMFPLHVVSDSPDFVAQEDHTIYAPAVLDASLQLETTAGGLGVRVSNGDGPILAFEPPEPAPPTVTREMWGQHYTHTRGLQHGIWEWDGSLLEHGRGLRNWRLLPHPFWMGLDVGRIRRCYRQQVLAPGTVGHERFYAMRPVPS